MIKRGTTALAACWILVPRCGWVAGQASQDCQYLLVQISACHELDGWPNMKDNLCLKALFKPQEEPVILQSPVQTTQEELVGLTCPGPQALPVRCLV